MELVYEILDVVGAILILLGSVFLLLGAIGIYRMPDLYNRLQAGTKATTLGAMSLIFGVGLMEPSWLFKLVIIILFIAFANPLSSHALARASYRQGKKPYYSDKEDEVRIDQYKKVVKKELKKLKKKLKEEV